MKCCICGDEAQSLQFRVVLKGVPFKALCEVHSDRIPCSHPDCQRTRAANPALGATQWWVCADHWAKVTPLTRRMHFKFKRQWRRYGFHLDDAAVVRLEHRMARMVLS